MFCYAKQGKQQIFDWPFLTVWDCPGFFVREPGKEVNMRAPQDQSKVPFARRNRWKCWMQIGVLKYCTLTIYFYFLLIPMTGIILCSCVCVWCEWAAVMRGNRLRKRKIKISIRAEHPWQPRVQTANNCNVVHGHRRATASAAVATSLSTSAAAVSAVVTARGRPGHTDRKITSSAVHHRIN